MKKQRTILLISVSLAAIILLGGIYLYFSSKNPSQDLSIQEITDRTSHYYQTEKPFKYGDYEFTVSSSTMDIGTKEDCPAKSKIIADKYGNSPISHGWQSEYDSYMESCNANNKEKDDFEAMDTRIKIKNFSDQPKEIRQDWFKLVMNGVTYNNDDGIGTGVSHGIDYHLKSIMGPGQTMDNSLSTKVERSSAIELYITLPGKASQIVKLR